jgi:hypothetical protein
LRGATLIFQEAASSSSASKSTPGRFLEGGTQIPRMSVKPARRPTVPARGGRDTPAPLPRGRPCRAAGLVAQPVAEVADVGIAGKRCAQVQFQQRPPCPRQSHRCKTLSPTDLGRTRPWRKVACQVISPCAHTRSNRQYWARGILVCRACLRCRGLKSRQRATCRSSGRCVCALTMYASSMLATCRLSSASLAPHRTNPRSCCPASHAAVAAAVHRGNVSRRVSGRS